MSMRRMACAGWLLVHAAVGAVYEIGPGRQMQSIADAPWAALQPGDTVLIHWRAEPYREKWVLCRQGRADAPIVVRGVPGPNGELPVITGERAATAKGLNYWNEARGVLKIGGANTPPDTMPRYLVIDGLEFRGAHPPNSFTNDSGGAETYAANAAGIYVEKAENLTIRHCVLRDNGNGLFIGTTEPAPTRDILVESNWLLENGNTGSAFEHNSYTEALGITFQFNRYGPLRPGADGNNLKDRSAGLVVRYNWIEGGNRQLDLVEAGGSAALLGDPRYRRTFVYGNVLIEPDGAGNRQIVHYGGDGADTARYRKGVLSFYSNTVVSTRADRTTLLRLSTDEERCEARNNVIYTSAPGSTLSLLDAGGVLEFLHNWIKPGWVRSFGNANAMVIATNLAEINHPGFLDEAAQEFRLRAPIAAAPVDPSLAAGGHAIPQTPAGHSASRCLPRRTWPVRSGSVAPSKTGERGLFPTAGASSYASPQVPSSFGPTDAGKKAGDIHGRDGESSGGVVRTGGAGTH